MTREEEEQYDLERACEHFRTHRRFERMPRKAGDLLSQLISRRGFTQNQFNEELQGAWQAAVGKRFSDKTRATVIKRGTLEVLVDSSPAMQQLAFSKSLLLEKMQTELPDARIKAIRFRVGRIRT